MMQYDVENNIMWTAFLLWAMAAVLIYTIIITYHAAEVFRWIGWTVCAIAGGFGVIEIVRIWRKK